MKFSRRVKLEKVIYYIALRKTNLWIESLTDQQLRKTIKKIIFLFLF